MWYDRYALSIWNKRLEFEKSKRTSCVNNTINTAMNKSYRKKEMEARFFLNCLLDKMFDGDTLCESPFFF